MKTFFEKMKKKLEFIISLAKEINCKAQAFKSIGFY